jgi:phosphatidylglycerol:prolipoprotein diacylglycerol transferase
MTGGYVHDIDPIIATVFGIHLWWYGLSYSLGFLNAHRFVSRQSSGLALASAPAYDLSMLLAIGVLLGGRLVQVVFYEWPFYSEHIELIHAYWLGGMATHGLLLGGLAGIWLFSHLREKPFLAVTDALAIPAAFILGVGRIGNFIDGQIVGSVTDVWWAVKFPDADGFRHPVVLYDGIKNLLIIPVLAYAARRAPPRGVITGLFLFLYAFLRLFVDVFREYPTDLLGLPTGQVLNLAMAGAGFVLMIVAFRRRGNDRTEFGSGAVDCSWQDIAWRKVIFAVVLLFSLVMPSDWTQDVPARYGKRHEGLHNSSLYPPIPAEKP